MIIVLICYLNSIINTYITYIDSADSPSGISLRSPLLVRSPPTSYSSSREESSWDSFQPLLPEVCLSQIWQETQIAVRYTKLLIAGWRVSLWELVLWLVILFQTSKYLHVHTLWNPTIQPVFLKLIIMYKPAGFFVQQFCSKARDISVWLTKMTRPVKVDHFRS